VRAEAHATVRLHHPLVTAKKAEERAKAELEVESGFVDLFGLDSGQSQRSDCHRPCISAGNIS